MASKFENYEKTLPAEHWQCRQCSAKNNLIRPLDPSKPTYCVPCLNEMGSNLDHALHQFGVKWLLESLIVAMEKVPRITPRRYVADYAINEIIEKTKKWEKQNEENRDA